jgi:hypothetical protein
LLTGLPFPLTSHPQTHSCTCPSSFPLFISHVAYSPNLCSYMVSGLVC